MSNEITIETNDYNRLFPNNDVYIYGLVSSIDNEIFYIGKSTRPKFRKQVHMCNATSYITNPSAATGVYKRIIEILSNNGEIRQTIIEIIPYHSQNITSLKENYWIHFYLNKGVELTNS